jgi:hypothetical protein
MGDLKIRGCEVCRKEFKPWNTMVRVCSQRCAEKVPKIARKAHKEAKDRTQKLSHWLKLTEAVINAYVRARDRNLGCVSCDKPASWGGQWHASHFRSVGAASGLRFHLWNVHKACGFVCNHHKSGNIAEYEPRLRAKIGDEKVDWLKTQNQRTVYTREYLARLRKVFAKKTRRLERR